MPAHVDDPVRVLAGKIPINEQMAKGEIDPKKYFGGPLSRHGQGIGKNPKEGFWSAIAIHTPFVGGCSCCSPLDQHPRLILLSCLLWFCISRILFCRFYAALPDCQRSTGHHPATV